jgi:hypothetical protein
MKPNQGQLQVHYQGSGNGHDFNLDIWWSHIFNYTPVASSQCGGFNVVQTVTVGLAYISVLP